MKMIQNKLGAILAKTKKIVLEAILGLVPDLPPNRREYESWGNE
jgi:hypothetical protein